MDGGAPVHAEQFRGGVITGYFVHNSLIPPPRQLPPDIAAQVAEVHIGQGNRRNLGGIVVIGNYRTIYKILVAEVVATVLDVKGSGEGFLAEG